MFFKKKKCTLQDEDFMIVLVLFTNNNFQLTSLATVDPAGVGVHIASVIV